MKKKLMISASIALGIALAGGVLGSFTASHPLDVNAEEANVAVKKAAFDDATSGAIFVDGPRRAAEKVADSYTLLSPESTSSDGFYAEGDGDRAEWALPGYVEAVWLKNNSSNPIALNYAEMRFYTKHSLTITPTNNAEITSIVFTDPSKSAKAFDASLTNATLTNNKPVYTLTPTDTTQPVVVDFNAQYRAATVVINYAYSATTEFGTLDHIEVNIGTAKTEFSQGDAFSSEGIVVTAYDTTGIAKVLSEGFTVDINEGTLLNEIGSKVVTVSYTLGDVTKTDTYTIEVKEKIDYAFEFDSKLFAKPNATADLGGINWTLDAEFSGSQYYFGFDSGKGHQFGSKTYKASKVSLRTTDLFLASTDGALVQKVVVNASGANNINAKLEVKIGDTIIGTAQEITGTPTDYAFVVPNALMGHIEILLNPNRGDDLGAAVYVKSIAVYADETNVDASLALLVAQEIEAADVCSDDLVALQGVKDSYDLIEDKALINYILLDDYADGDTDHTGAKVYNRLTVEEKMAAIESAIATKSIEASSFGVFGNNNNTKFITLLSLASLIGVGGIGFFFLKKKKGAH